MKRADIILLSENIFTASTLGMISGGVAIAGNKIELVGSKEAVLALADENTVIRDFGKQLITPGICDSHVHMFGGCYLTAGPNLAGLSSAEECARHSMSSTRKMRPIMPTMNGSAHAVL